MAAATTEDRRTSVDSVTEALAAVGEKQLVLIAIDASEFSEYAFEYYAANLHSDLNELLMVHIADPPLLPIGRDIDKPEFDQQMAVEQQRVKLLEDKYGAKMTCNKMKGRIVAIFSNKPGETLCKVANRENASMIVIGTRGLGAVRRTFLGSVSDFVLHHANCPVCVCRQMI